MDAYLTCCLRLSANSTRELMLAVARLDMSLGISISMQPTIDMVTLPLKLLHGWLSNT